MVRSIDGHGFVSASRPPPTSISFPLASSSAAVYPGRGMVALPGFVDVMPGSGEMLIAPLHEGADRRGRGVEDRHAVSFADIPEAILLGPIRCALIHQHRGAVR